MQDAHQFAVRIENAEANRAFLKACALERAEARQIFLGKSQEKEIPPVSPKEWGVAIPARLRHKLKWLSQTRDWYLLSCRAKSPAAAGLLFSETIERFLDLARNDKG